MPIARRLLYTYFDVVLVLVFVGLIGAFTYWFWPNVEPSVCVNDQDAIIDCGITDADGNTVNLMPSHCVSANGKPISCSYYDAKTFFGDFGLTLGAVFSWLIYFFIGQPIRLKEIFFKNDDISAFLPMSQRNLKKNAVLMLGLGRCGKTELIKTLSYGSVSVEDSITENWATYGFAIESYDLKEKTATKHMLLVNDYRGQKGGQIASEMQKAERKNAERKNAGRKTDVYSGRSINAVILMVDLFPWAVSGDENETYTQFDDNRIREHLTEWSRTTLDICFGFLHKGSLRQIFLFINKLDQLENYDKHGKNVNTAIEKFNEIRDDLEQRAKKNDIEFCCIVGSVRTGQGVIGDNSLVEALVNQSVEIDAKRMGALV